MFHLHDKSWHISVEIMGYAVLKDTSAATTSTVVVRAQRAAEIRGAAKEERSAAYMRTS